MNPRLLGAHDIVAASATCCVVVGRFTVAVSVLLPKPAGSVAAPGAKPAVAPPTAASSSKLYSLSVTIYTVRCMYQYFCWSRMGADVGIHVWCKALTAACCA